MKRKVLPLLVIVIIGSTASLTAQIEKKDIILGANLGLNYGSSNGSMGSSRSNSNLSPRIGFGVGHNAVLGLKTNLSYYGTKSDNGDKRHSIVLGGGVFWRRYIPIKKQIGWYFEPSANIAWQKDIYKYVNIDKMKETSMRYEIAIIPGIYYQPLPKFLVNIEFGGVGYSYSKHRNPGTSSITSSNVYLSLLNTFTFGVEFILNKKQS